MGSTRGHEWGTSAIRLRAPTLVQDTANEIFLACERTVGRPPPGVAVWSNGYIGVWHFNDDGLLATDATPGSHHASAVADPLDWYDVDGRVAGCARFEGNNVLTVPEHATFDLSSALTIEAWVQLPNVAPSRATRTVLDKPQAYRLVAQGPMEIDAPFVGGVDWARGPRSIRSPPAATRSPATRAASRTTPAITSSAEACAMGCSTPTTPRPISGSRARWRSIRRASLL